MDSDPVCGKCRTDAHMRIHGGWQYVCGKCGLVSKRVIPNRYDDLVRCKNEDGERVSCGYGTGGLSSGDRMTNEVLQKCSSRIKKICGGVPTVDFLWSLGDADSYKPGASRVDPNILQEARWLVNKMRVLLLEKEVGDEGALRLVAQPHALNTGKITINVVTESRNEHRVYEKDGNIFVGGMRVDNFVFDATTHVVVFNRVGQVLAAAMCETLRDDSTVTVHCHNKATLQDRATNMVRAELEKHASTRTTYNMSEESLSVVCLVAAYIHAGRRDWHTVLQTFKEHRPRVSKKSPSQLRESFVMTKYNSVSGLLCQVVAELPRKLRPSVPSVTPSQLRIGEHMFVYANSGKELRRLPEDTSVGRIDRYYVVTDCRSHYHGTILWDYSPGRRQMRVTMPTAKMWREPFDERKHVWDDFLKTHMCGKWPASKEGDTVLVKQTFGEKIEERIVDRAAHMISDETSAQIMSNVLGVRSKKRKVHSSLHEMDLATGATLTPHKRRLMEMANLCRRFGQDKTFDASDRGPLLDFRRRYGGKQSTATIASHLFKTSDENVMAFMNTVRQY